MLSAVLGCGGSMSPVPSSPTPPTQTGSITVTAPANGSTVNSLPLTLQVTLAGGATLSSSKVTVDGQDVTADLVAGANGTLQATLGSGIVYVGSNRIAATVGSQVTKSTFTYDPTLAGAPSPEVTNAPSDVVPIQTRVVANVTDSQGNSIQAWAIQIGSAQYVQPHPEVTDGFQVLLLKRSDLTLVSNTDYDFAAGGVMAVQAFDNAIVPQSSMKTSCGGGGCLEVIQSLGLMVSVCPTEMLIQCYLNLGQIGGTNVVASPLLSLNSGLQNVAYSFIGNVNDQTLHPGSNFERVTCSATSNCPGDNAPSSDQIIQGMVPNGADGTLGSLNGTGSPGTTTLAATSTMPALTVSNNGAIAGELVLDDYNNYTFTYAEPTVHFAMGEDPNDPNKNEIQLRVPSESSFRLYGNLTSTVGESAELPPNADGSRPGGFLLTAWNATTFQNLLNSTFTLNSSYCGGADSCAGPDGVTIYPISQLQTQIDQLNSRNVIFFLQSIGSLSHNCPPGQQCEANSNNQGGLPIQDAWDRAAQGVQDIGGTYATFVSLNDPAYALDNYDQYTPSAVPVDDYMLVGQWWFNSSGVANPYGKEESSQINRQTIKGGGGARMTGLLEKGRDGYFRATLESSYGEFFPPGSSTYFAAPLLPPVPWPLTGPNDASGLRIAYQWISEQLLGCVSGCKDIRAAYENLNQDPAIWLALLTSLQFPADCTSSDCGLGCTNNDFQIAKTQLITELKYLGEIREYQNNLLGLLQAEQSNQGLILQQELDVLLANTTVQLPSTSYSAEDWRTWASDGLKLLGPIGSLGTAAGVGTGIIATDGIVTAFAPYALPAVAVASALGVAAIDLTAERTNDGNGLPLEEQEHELLAASNLAGNLADQYSDILSSIGNDFVRIYADWGRLSAVGSAITNNKLVWDSGATGKLLKTFDLTARRQFVRTLLPAGYYVYHFQYDAPGINPGFGNVFLPSGYDPGYANGCQNFDFMLYQMQGDPNDPNTQQTAASYMYIPGAPMDGPGVPLQSANNVYPFDSWWDLWVITQFQDTGDVCAETNHTPTNSLFLNTGMFTPIDPGNSNALGLYKVWLYQRDFATAGAVLHPVSPGTAANFWNNQLQGDQSINVKTFNLGGTAAPDPDSY